MVPERKILSDLKKPQVLLEKEKWETQQWINSMSTLTAKCDSQGRILTCNQPFLSLLQTNSSKFKSQYICDITELELFANCKTHLKNILMGGKAGKKGKIEIELPINNSPHKNFLFSVNPVYDSLGNIAFLAIELIDISEQVKLRELVIQKEKEYSRRLEKEIIEVKKVLTKTEEFNKNIIDSAPMGIVYLDEEHRVVLVNPKLERILEATGISKDHIYGKQLNELNIYQANHLWGKTSGSSNYFHRFGKKKMVVNHKGKELKYLEVLSGPLRTPNGNTHGTILLFNDVTEKIQLETELLNIRIQAEKMSSLGLLVSGVAHEINNPLTSILGCAEYLIEETIMDVDAQKAIHIIFEDSKRADKIVKNLLLIAHPPEPESASQILDLNELIENTISLRIQEIHRKWLRAILNLSRDIQPIMANKIQLQQVILNILQNSIFAIEESGEGDRIIITTKEENNWIFMQIEDNGPGIAFENHSKIFDPFFTTKPPGKGTGLGLSISYGIIKKHGGYITLDSNLESGTCFIIRLPVANSTFNETEVVEFENLNWKPSQVLIIDTETNLRYSLAKYIENLGCRVFTTNNGPEALRIIATKSFDLILADVKAPVLTGMDLYYRLEKEHPELAERFVLMTSLSSKENKETALKPDIPLLQKPFSHEDVIRMFSQIRHRLDLQ